MAPPLLLLRHRNLTLSLNLSLPSDKSRPTVVDFERLGKGTTALEISPKAPRIAL